MWYTYILYIIYTIPYLRYHIQSYNQLNSQNLIYTIKYIPWYIGHITVRHHGGGHKRKYRVMDFSNENKTSIVTTVCYDPMRSAFISLNFDLAKKEFHHAISTNNVGPGSLITCNDDGVELKLGKFILFIVYLMCVYSVYILMYVYLLVCILYWYLCMHICWFIRCVNLFICAYMYINWWGLK